MDTEFYLVQTPQSKNSLKRSMGWPIQRDNIKIDLEETDWIMMTTTGELSLETVMNLWGIF